MRTQYVKEGTTYEIDSRTTMIGNTAFSMAKKLNKVIFPKNIDGTTFNFQSFYGAQALTDIEVDEENETLSSVDGILYNKDKDTMIFYPAGREAKTFNIPEGVKTLYSGVFCFTENLENITFPSTLKTIMQTSICYTKVKSFVIPENVEELGFAAIYAEELDSIYFYNKDIKLANEAIYIYPDVDFKIYGYEGSTAQTYATENNKTFVALDGAKTVLNVLANNGISDTAINYDEPKEINISDILIPSVDKKVLTGLYSDSDRKTVAESTITLNEGENTLYSDWTDIGTLLAESDDKTGSTATTSGFDLFGAQFREETEEWSTGLRFCTRVSKDLISEIESKTGNSVECGYVLCKKDSVPENAELKVGTTTTAGKTITENAAPYKYYDGKGYFVYTAVIVGIPDDMKSTDIVARPYIKYTDANGVARYYYFTESGASNCGGGYYTSYSAVENAHNSAQ